MDDPAGRNGSSKVHCFAWGIGYSRVTEMGKVIHGRKSVSNRYGVSRFLARYSRRVRVRIWYLHHTGRHDHLRNHVCDGYRAGSGL